ncbi:hypothetical protein HI914_04365 [Erysiphe necator]|nr:hypothetical protein HI914_04365 [Erysiphe necator]
MDFATLREGFSIGVATKEDRNEIWNIFLEAFGSDELWKCLTKNVVDSKELFPWLIAHMAPRYETPDTIVFKITENATGKIVAWGAIQVPWKFLETEQAEILRAKAATFNPPPTIDGMNPEILKQVEKSVYAARLFGYDPENDYHRRGSMIRPGYQKMGFGTYIMHFCNQICDAKGERQWARSRPSSLSLFKKLGFVEKGNLDTNLKRWGGNKDKSGIPILVRVPKSDKQRLF